MLTLFLFCRLIHETFVLVIHASPDGFFSGHVKVVGIVATNGNIHGEVIRAVHRRHVEDWSRWGRIFQNSTRYFLPPHPSQPSYNATNLPLPPMNMPLTKQNQPVFACRGVGRVVSEAKREAGEAVPPLPGIEWAARSSSEKLADDEWWAAAWTERKPLAMKTSDHFYCALERCVGVVKHAQTCELKIYCVYYE